MARWTILYILISLFILKVSSLTKFKYAPVTRKLDSGSHFMSNNYDDEFSFMPIWKSVKSTLPAVITGARLSSTGDENPAGALYNTFFVRIPTIAVGIFYSKMLLQYGDEFIMSANLGFGPFVVPPISIAICLVLILRY